MWGDPNCSIIILSPYSLRFLLQVSDHTKTKVILGVCNIKIVHAFCWWGCTTHNMHSESFCFKIRKKMLLTLQNIWIVGQSASDMPLHDHRTIWHLMIYRFARESNCSAPSWSLTSLCKTFWMRRLYSLTLGVRTAKG